MERRTFLKNGCLACIGAVSTASLFTGCVSTKYISGNMGKDGLTVEKNDFLINGAYSSFIIVRNELLKFPICVFRKSETEYTALWMQCSHQGAELQASGDRLQCSAHGSEFDANGLVKTGPAATPLRKFPVSVGKTDLFIDLRKQS